MKFSKDFKKIKGDASIRKFYRNTKKNSIIVFANIEKIKNLLIYDSINKILIKNNIIAPKLLSQNYRNNYIEIQDLGNKTIYQKFIKNKKNHYLILKKVINVLNKIQKIKDKKVKNFNNKLYNIKNYNNKVLLEETKLFNDWYVPKKLNKKKIYLFKDKFNKEIKLLLSKLKFKNNTFVHRDFHVSNLIINSKNQIGLIDNQDALIGNRAYDLASLIDDVRYKTSNSLKDKVYNYYLKTNKNIHAKKFKNDFDILSVLRNLKIIGIFTRLAERDKKKKYLKLIPYAWKMIDNRMNKNKEFYNLKLLLASSFPKLITNLDEN
ncbi:phosphotransferase [Candidatus Pelagibacter bacterium nBUS_28]|uniref:phosphotransferase n=1 Tax=Candidatus Pelagibacter bacterium nBUS_28 TaxID=3374189 RepID=UPI003EBC072F